MYLFICIRNTVFKKYMWIFSSHYSGSNILYPPTTSHVDILSSPISFRLLPELYPPICFRTESSWVEENRYRKRMQKREKTPYIFNISLSPLSLSPPILSPVCNMIVLAYTINNVFSTHSCLLSSCLYYIV